ncbi:MAG: ABC transporter ATP-binding protein [Chitinophagaceae bacterium]|nr:ABC transporter ATP-binding protein [Chitinophagaceae bacterium]
MVLNIRQISKSYKTVRALQQVSFDVPENCVYGILGPNGSGKTTLLGILLDILKPDSGTFQWFGQGGNAEIRKKIGSLLETPNFYSYLSGAENLRITQSVSGRGRAKDIDDVLHTVGLHNRRWAPFKNYSLGMKQRLAIAAALLGNPKVLVLDEPTNGLDPAGIAEVRELIVQLYRRGHTIIMASHLLDEVEKVCTHVAILKNGQLLASGSTEEILSEEDIVELGAENITQLKELAAGLGGKMLENHHTNGLIHISFPKGKIRPEEINRYCFERGIILQHLALKRKKLETLFFELTGK